jgi:hypothetical protein
MARLRSIVSAFTVSALLPLSSAALAQDNAAKGAILAREAESLMASGKVAEACAKLDESQRIDPRGSTLLDLALCREKEGRIGTAYRLFEDVEKVSLKENRNDRVTTARVRKNALFAKVPRLTLTVPSVEGIEVRVGLASDPAAATLVSPSEYGKALAVDPGELRVAASAPGHKTWESKVELKQGTKKAVTVGPLEKGQDPAGAAAAAPPAKTEQPAATTEAKGDDAKEQPSEAPSAAPAASASSTAKHEGGRLVVDVQFLAGGHLSAIGNAPLAEIDGTQYIYQGTFGSEFLAACGDPDTVEGAGVCDATFDPSLALLLGGQIFVGYAITEDVQLGARGFGAGHIPGGFTLLGGPSISFALSESFWLGASILVGTTQQEALVTGGEGSVPEDLIGENDGSDVVDIPVQDLSGGFASGNQKAMASSGFDIGGALEVSYVLFDNPSDSLFGGALMVSAWPTVLAAPGRGLVAALPIGIGYRFY